MKIEGNQKEGNEGNVFRRYSGIQSLFRGVPAFRCSMFRRCSAVPRGIPRFGVRGFIVCR